MVTSGLIRHGDVSSVESVGALIDFSVQAKPARFESTAMSALHTLPFSFTPGDALRTQRVGVSSAEVC